MGYNTGGDWSVSRGIGNSNAPMPVIGYNTQYGFGIGVNYNGSSNMYYPGYESRVNNAMEQNVNAAVNSARQEYFYTQGLGERAPMSAYTLRENDVDWEILWSEFKTGTGPERSLFRNDHPMVNDLKNSWIVNLARMQFLYQNKSLRRWNAPYGITGISFSYSMTEQFIGGARVTIIPNSGGYYYQVDDTKDRYSLLLHLNVANPNRVQGQIIPYGTTYQRYIWFER